MGEEKQISEALKFRHQVEIKPTNQERTDLVSSLSRVQDRSVSMFSFSGGGRLGRHKGCTYYARLCNQFIGRIFQMNADTLETGRKGSRPFRIADDISTVIDTKLTQVIIEAINPVIADGFALYEKTRTFYLRTAHWPNRDHEILFDEQAEEIFASMDILAGRVREMGGTPLRSISHSGETKSVEAYQVDSLSLSEMIEELIADNKRIAASLESARQICEKQHILSMDILLMDVLDKTETRIKQLRQAVIKYSAKQSRSL